MTKRFGGLFGLCAAVVLLLPFNAQAQPVKSGAGVPSTSPIAPALAAPDDVTAQARRFHRLFSDLSRRFNVVFVVEGVPLKIHEVGKGAVGKDTPTEFAPPDDIYSQQLKQLTEKQERLKKENPATPSAETAEAPEATTVTALVEKAALEYDYQVEKRGIVFLLRKRYTSERDFPDVPLAECAASLKDVTRLLAPFSPNVKDEIKLGGMHSAETAFMASLTEEQEQQMRNEGLKVATLNPTQQHNIWQTALYYYIQTPYEYAYGTMAQFDRLLKKTTVLRQKKEDDRLALGYEDPTGWFGGPLFMPLDQLPVFSTPFPTPTEFEVKREAMWAVQRKAAGATTLQQVAAALNLRRSAPTDPPVVVAPALAEKNVILIGEQKITPTTLLKAIAEIYGLHFKNDPEGALHLTRRPVMQARTLSELPTAIVSAFPDPFLRILHLDDTRRTNKEAIELRKRLQTPNAITPQNYEEAQLRQRQLSLQTTIWWRRPDQLSMAAIRRLSVQTRPLFEKQPKVTVPVAALDSDVKRSISSILMMQTLGDLQRVLIPTPPVYIVQWDKLGVMGGKFKNEKGQTFYRLYLAIPSADGKGFHTTVGGQSAPFTE